MERTISGGIRQPVFKGLRDDKSPRECISSGVDKDLGKKGSEPHIDTPEAPEWYDSEKQEYVVTFPGGYGGARLMKPIRYTIEGDLHTITLGDFNPSDELDLRLYGQYDIVFQLLQEEEIYKILYAHQERF